MVSIIASHCLNCFPSGMYCSNAFNSALVGRRESMFVYKLYTPFLYGITKNLLLNLEYDIFLNICDEFNMCSFCDADGAFTRSSAYPVSRGDLPNNSRNEVVTLPSGRSAAAE